MKKFYKLFMVAFLSLAGVGASVTDSITTATDEAIPEATLKLRPILAALGENVPIGSTQEIIVETPAELLGDVYPITVNFTKQSEIPCQFEVTFSAATPSLQFSIFSYKQEATYSVCIAFDRDSGKVLKYATSQSALIIPATESDTLPPVIIFNRDTAQYARLHLDLGQYGTLDTIRCLGYTFTANIPVWTVAESTAVTA